MTIGRDNERSRTCANDCKEQAGRQAIAMTGVPGGVRSSFACLGMRGGAVSECSTFPPSFLGGPLVFPVLFLLPPPPPFPRQPSSRERGGEKSRVHRCSSSRITSSNARFPPPPLPPSPPSPPPPRRRRAMAKTSSSSTNWMTVDSAREFVPPAWSATSMPQHRRWTIRGGRTTTDLAIATTEATLALTIDEAYRARRFLVVRLPLLPIFVVVVVVVVFLRVRRSGRCRRRRRARGHDDDAPPPRVHSVADDDAVSAVVDVVVVLPRHLRSGALVVRIFAFVDVVRRVRTILRRRRFALRPRRRGRRCR